MIGLISNGLGQWALATTDDREQAFLYILKAKHDAEIAKLQARIAELETKVRDMAMQAVADDLNREVMMEAQSVKVKPLVWADLGDRSDCIALPDPYQILGTNCGSGAPDDPLIEFKNFRVFDPFIARCVGREYETLEQAKAAAQADYERRILSALEVSDGCKTEHRYALNLATALSEKHFPENKDWAPLPDLLGLLTQIDNMTTALSRQPVTVQQAAERLITEINQPATFEDKPAWRHLSRLDLPSLRALAAPNKGEE